MEREDSYLLAFRNRLLIRCRIHASYKFTCPRAAVAAALFVNRGASGLFLIASVYASFA